MLVNSNINIRQRADIVNDCSLGNRLFKIASLIGIATYNGYSFGFPKWMQQDFFVNQLPFTDRQFKKVKVKPNFQTFDFGFRGFDYPDNIDLDGELASWRYFEHCESLIRFYFTLKPQCDPYKDCIVVHFRSYTNPAFLLLDESYYKQALKKLPKKPVIVVTDNIDNAYKHIKLNCDYTSNTPIVDFYLLSNADYLVMGNSTFSWWGAWLSKAETVVPKYWYVDDTLNNLMGDIYLKNWTIV